jgi:1,4-dihydroxy-2-naphthoate octaprenyltransferase
MWDTSTVIGQYFRMIRLHIVVGGILAFTLGALLALANGGSFDPAKFVLFYSVIFFGDLSTHFSNDYFDFEPDRLTSKKSVFSGAKILTKNPGMLRTVSAISVGLLAVSLLSAGLGVALNLAPIELLLIAFGINFLGWFYSAPPIRLVSRGLGELAIALAVGVGIPAVGYLSVKGQFDSLFALVALPFMLYGFMLALSLEAPDVEADRLGDKKTFGVFRGVRAVFGLAFAVAAVALLVFVGYAWLFGGYAVDFWVLGAFAVVPFVAGTVGLLGGCRSKKAETLAMVNVLSLFAINLLIVVYLSAVCFF